MSSIRIITSEEVKQRLSLAQQGAGTIPIVADLDLLRQYPSAAVLHGILLWISFQQDAEQHLSVEDIRKNVLGWSRDKFYRALEILENLGYIQRKSIPHKGTTLRVYLLPSGDYSENRNRLFRKSELLVPKIGIISSENRNYLFRKSEQSVPDSLVPIKFQEALNNINNKNTLNKEQESEILEEYIHLKIKIAGGRVKNAEAFRKFVWKEIVEGKIDSDILQRACKRVLFPAGTYKVVGGTIEWNGEKGIFRDEDGKVIQIIQELPAEARRAGDAK